MNLVSERKNGVPRSRANDLARFYIALEHLESGLGGKRKLSCCDGRMDWPEHGVYVFFEHGESRSGSGSGLRAVRVGTHALTSSSRRTLWNRLYQHRGVAKSGGGNHRGSVFRLLVGKALIERNPAWAIETWGEGQSAPRDVLDAEFELECQVSQVIGEMPFLWLRVDDRSQRRDIERNSIALLSSYNKSRIDPPSDYWLGLHCPSRNEKVQRSGLWNQEYVEDDYDPAFFSELENLVANQPK